MCQEGSCTENRTAEVCTQCGIIEGKSLFCEVCNSIACGEPACVSEDTDDHEHHSLRVTWDWQAVVQELCLDPWTDDWTHVTGRYVSSQA